jgi:hypothetical protein
MAKAIYVCYNEKEGSLSKDEIADKLTEICKEITPEHLEGKNHEIRSYQHIYIGISNPVGTIRRKDASLMLGFLNKNEEGWHQVKTKAPDGTFVIIRADDHYIELLTDVTGSRSLWYYVDHEKLIVSTSQIAITRYLQDFQLNKNVIPWILSTGALGPGNSWDIRVKKVKPNSSILLDRKSWILTESTETVKFSKKIKDFEEGKNRLKEHINQLVKHLDYDPSTWYIPLSGGYDSRALILFLRNHKPRNRYKTVTWGTKESRSRKASDAHIAGELSNEIGVPNLFYESNRSSLDIAGRLDRFIFFSEGTVDHIAAYMDGFDLWKDLMHRGCEGIVRGEIPFVPRTVKNEAEARKLAGLLLCSDFENLKEAGEWGEWQQTIPPELTKCESESFQDWLDRLYLEYRVPVIVSSLADIKYSYVEQSMPFFSEKMIQLFCSFSDELRKDKKIFKDIVNELGVDTPIATKSANEAVELILRNPEMVQLMRKILSDQRMLEFFPEEFLNTVAKNMKRYHRIFYRPYKFYFRLYNGVRFQAYTILKKRHAFQSLSDNLIAFRMVIFLKMYNVLSSNQK